MLDLFQTGPRAVLGRAGLSLGNMGICVGLCQMQTLGLCVPLTTSWTVRAPSSLSALWSLPVPRRVKEKALEASRRTVTQNGLTRSWNLFLLCFPFLPRGLDADVFVFVPLVPECILMARGWILSGFCVVIRPCSCPCHVAECLFCRQYSMAPCLHSASAHAWCRMLQEAMLTATVWGHLLLTFLVKLFMS